MAEHLVLMEREKFTHLQSQMESTEAQVAEARIRARTLSAEQETAAGRLFDVRAKTLQRLQDASVDADEFLRAVDALRERDQHTLDELRLELGRSHAADMTELEGLKEERAAAMAEVAALESEVGRLRQKHSEQEAEAEALSHELDLLASSEDAMLLQQARELFIG